MTLKLSLQEAQQQADKYMKKGYHCGPAVLQVMWEAYDMQNEELLWAGIPLMGGLSGQNKATCGAVAGAAVSLGLIHRTPLSDREKAKAARNSAREKTIQLTRDFDSKFGHVNCQALLGIDFTQPGAYQEFKRSDLPDKKCYQYVQFIIKKLFEIENQSPAMQK